MTRKIEDNAKGYLLNEFNHPNCKFRMKDSGEQGFDLWLDEKDQPPKKVELKATEAPYNRPSNLFERLVFNAEVEKQLFENGESIIVRVFMGSSPPRVFVITNSIFSGGAQLTVEARYVIRGKINYTNSIIELA